MFEKLTLSDVPTEGMIPLDSFSVSQAFFALLGFAQGTESCEVYKVDAGSLASLRRAAAQYVKQPKDRTITFTQYKVGKAPWARLAKDAKAPNGAKTRTATTQAYSGEALRTAIAKLREDHRIALDRTAVRKAADGTGHYVVTLSRIDTATDTEDAA